MSRLCVFFSQFRMDYVNIAIEPIVDPYGSTIYRNEKKKNFFSTLFVFDKIFTFTKSFSLDFNWIDFIKKDNNTGDGINNSSSSNTIEEVLIVCTEWID